MRFVQNRQKYCCRANSGTAFEPHACCVFWAVKELGLSETSPAQKLGTTQLGISRAVQRGERLAIGKEYKLNTQNA